MRITAFSDDKRILDTSLEQLKLINPKVSQEDNKVGSFTFTIYPDHPYYNFIEKMKSIITVYEDGIKEPLFRGRVYDEKTGFYNEKQVSCEGELAFLLDSIQRPYSFPAEGQSGTPAELFAQYINNHNAQVDEARQFKVGNITVTDPNDYIVRSNSDYVSTWDELNAKLIDHLGGHLWVRHEADGNYIDYLADFNMLSNQTIEFGKNLLDLQKKIKAESFATALIPLGAKLKDEQGNETSERLTIKAVNNNVDYVYNDEAVAKYGYIFTTNTWDDVTVASNLKSKGQAYIDDMAQFTASIEVSAADLNGATIDGEMADVNSFRIGRYVKVNTKPHSIQNQNFIVSKLSRELLKPENTKLTLGTTYKTLTEKQLSQMEQLNQYVQTVSGQIKKNIGIKSSSVLYQEGESGTSAPTTGKWTEDIPSVSRGRYLWTKTEITYTDDSILTIYAVSYQGINGINGENGADGKDGTDGRGISSTSVSYQASSSGTTAPTGTWTKEIPTVNNGQYLWTRTIYTFTDKTAQTVYSVGYKGTNGSAGEAVKSITNYYLATSASSGVTTNTGGWTTTFQTITKDKPYLWNYEVVTGSNNTTLSITSPVIIGHFGVNGADGTNGKDGISITGITEHYAVSPSNSTAPSKWYDSVQIMTATNKYLWNYETISYSDGTSDDTLKRVIGAYGDSGKNGADGKDGTDGRGISSTSVSYQVSTSGSDVPSGTWLTSIPNVSANQYLWTRTIITYTDKTMSTSYSIGKMGADGVNGKDGKGISSSTVTYKASSSGTAIPSGVWSTTIPAVSAGQYLWTKTVTTYTDNTSITAYSVGRMGTNGINGKDAAIQSKTEPADKTYMWLDTSLEPPILKQWNGSAWVVVNDMSNTITQLEQRFEADISTSEKSLKQTMSESYYTKDATDKLVSSLSSSMEHTAQGFEMQFNNLTKNLADVSNNTDTRFNEISKYIRFVDGNIVLGEAGSELVLKIQNDRISFSQNNTEVAYFSNRKLYVTDGEYTNSLQLGKFAFIPRTNGNLSFKKIID
jgi:phage minor structural protein